MDPDKSLWTDEHHRWAEAKTSGRHNQKVRKDCCRWQTFQMWDHTQCGYKAKHQGLWCGLHSPEATEKRRVKKEENYLRQRYKWDFSSWERRYREAKLDAFEEVAKGELNDPAGYCSMVVEEWEARKPKPPADATPRMLSPQE